MLGSQSLDQSHALVRGSVEVSMKFVGARVADPHHCNADRDRDSNPDPAFHFNADPDSDPAFL